VNTILPDPTCLDPDCPSNAEAAGTCPVCGRLAREPVTGPRQTWALLLDGGPDPARGVLVIVDGGDQPPSVHHVGLSASLRSLAESGWSPAGSFVHRSWGLAVPVTPGN
jgi:hypothetical protein